MTSLQKFSLLFLAFLLYWTILINMQNAIISSTFKSKILYDLHFPLDFSFLCSPLKHSKLKKSSKLIGQFLFSHSLLKALQSGSISDPLYLTSQPITVSCANLLLPAYRKAFLLLLWLLSLGLLHPLLLISPTS